MRQTKDTGSAAPERSRLSRRGLLIGGGSVLTVGALGFYLRDLVPGLPDLQPAAESFALTADEGQGFDRLTTYDADGVGWFDTPKPPLVHMHYRQTFAFAGLDSISRCPCGAMRWNGRSEDGLPWAPGMSDEEKDAMYRRNSLDPKGAPFNDPTVAAADYLTDGGIELDPLNVTYSNVRSDITRLAEEAISRGVRTNANAMQAAVVLLERQRRMDEN